jgi:hypothetical protein
MSETSIQMFQSRAELAKKQGIEPIVEMKPEIRLIPNVIRSYRRLPSPEPAIF